MTRRRPWRAYLILLGSSFALLFAVAAWRTSTCEPCSTPVRLDRPGTYRLDSRFFAGERYRASFLVQGPVPSTFAWYEQSDRHLWRETPPRVRLEVRDSSDRVLLRDVTEIENGYGWIVSGTAGAGPVDVYKFTSFVGRPFRKYRTTLIVEQGSPSAAMYRVTFRLLRSCEYEGLAYIVWGILLALAFLLVAVAMAIILWLIRPRPVV